jgi:glycosyltransferase involved in cell wall biosynthesis
MLKICIVNPFEHGGGAEYQISLLIDALAATNRFEIHYLAHFLDDNDRARNYSVSRVGAGGPVPRLGYVMDAVSLYRKLREIDPGVIYQRVACAYTGICALYAGNRWVPLIWHVAHDTDVSSEMLGPARNVLRLHLEKWAVGYGARRATGIVVQTQHQARLLLQNYGRTPAAVIPNFHPPAAEPLDKRGPFTVLWVANLKPWKRPEIFVRLASSLSGCAHVRFIMVGASASSGGGWQESLMQSIGATNNLEYLGQKSHAEVNELLGRSHVFVNTSVHEGFPNTFIQAWLREVVVVSLSVDPDGVLAQGAGIAAQSEEGLIAAVRGLIDNPESLAALAKRGREHAAARHSLANAHRLAELLEAYAAGGIV